MTQTEFLRLLDANSTLRAILSRLDALDLPDSWIAGGCLFQTAWNMLSGEPPTRAIEDYDILYFDPSDLSAESELRANHRARIVYSGLDCRVDVRNQARVHLWYAQEFGVEGYPRLTKTTEGIDHFLAMCCMVGIRKLANGGVELYAPFGVEDILSQTMRPNPRFPDAPRVAYEAKAGKWLGLWPNLKVQPFA